MTWTVVPTSKPLYVVATAVPSFGTTTSLEKLADAIDSLECVDFTPHEVHGLIVDIDEPERAPHGYLCAHRSFMAEWRPFFAAATAGDAEKQARDWVTQRRETVDRLYERRERLDAEKAAA